MRFNLRYYYFYFTFLTKTKSWLSSRIIKKLTSRSFCMSVTWICQEVHSTKSLQLPTHPLTDTYVFISIRYVGIRTFSVHILNKTFTNPLNRIFSHAIVKYTNYYNLRLIIPSILVQSLFKKKKRVLNYLFLNIICIIISIHWNLITILMRLLFEKFFFH